METAWFDDNEKLLSLVTEWTVGQQLTALEHRLLEAKEVVTVYKGRVIKTWEEFIHVFVTVRGKTIILQNTQLQAVNNFNNGDTSRIAVIKVKRKKTYVLILATGVYELESP